MWLAVLLSVTAIVLLVRVGRPSPEPGVTVAGMDDSVAAATDTQRYQGNRWHKKSYRGKAAAHPVQDGGEPKGSPPSNHVVGPNKPLLVDLNEADTLTLQMLHGIGPAFARRIVRYRERLGGFYRVEQLREVYGMTDDRYLPLLPHLTLQTDSIRRIDINKVTIKELMRHPYVDPWLARDIIRWRDQGHPYHSADDLRLVATMDDSTLARLAPYLSFE